MRFKIKQIAITLLIVAGLIAATVGMPWLVDNKPKAATLFLHGLYICGSLYMCWGIYMLVGDWLKGREWLKRKK